MTLAGAGTAIGGAVVGLVVVVAIAALAVAYAYLGRMPPRRKVDLTTGRGKGSLTHVSTDETEGAP